MRTSEPRPSTPLGIWLLLGAGILILGASAILIRLAGVQADGIDPRALVVWRLLVTLALLAPFGIARRAEFAEVTRRDLALTVLSGLFLGLHFLAWFASLAFTDVASASVLVTTSPVFIVVLGVVWFRERPPAVTLAAIGVAVAGSVLLGTSEPTEGAFPQAALGNGLAAFAAAAIAVYLVVGQRVRGRLSFLAYFIPLNAVALGVALAACALGGVPLALPLPAIGMCAAMALGPGLLGHGSLSTAVRYVPAAFVGLLTLAEPVVSTLLAYGLFGEVPSALGVVGMALVLVSLGAVIVSKRSAGKSEN